MQSDVDISSGVSSDKGGGDEHEDAYLDSLFDTLDDALDALDFGDDLDDEDWYEEYGYIGDDWLDDEEGV